MRGRIKEKTPDRAKAIARANQRAHYRRRRKAYLELKRGKSCARCGFDDYRALAFHHTDPTEKHFAVASKHWIASWSTVLAEIEKCELICANCHSIEHHEHKEPGWGGRIDDEDPAQLALDSVL